MQMFQILIPMDDVSIDMVMPTRADACLIKSNPFYDTPIESVRSVSWD